MPTLTELVGELDLDYNRIINALATGNLEHTRRQVELLRTDIRRVEAALNKIVRMVEEHK